MLSLHPCHAIALKSNFHVTNKSSRKKETTKRLKIDSYQNVVLSYQDDSLNDYDEFDTEEHIEQPAQKSLFTNTLCLNRKQVTQNYCYNNNYRKIYHQVNFSKLSRLHLISLGTLLL